MGEENFFKNNEQKNEEDYRFVKEVRKKKTLRPKDVLIRLCCIVAGAVLFGVIAAFVFVHFLPVVQKEEEPASSEIAFEKDSPDTAQETERNVRGTTDGEEAPESAAVPTPIPTNVPDQTGPGTSDPSAEQEQSPVAVYSEMYKEMQSVAEEAMSFMVTVTGITNTEDWFNVQQESTKQASGVIVAENETEYFVLSEYRVVDTVERVVITFVDGSIVDGRYQMHDPNTNMAILKVDKSSVTQETKAQIKVAVLGNSYWVKQGEAVIALGSPMGYSNSVVYGQITSTTNTAATYDKQYNLFTTNMLGNSEGSGAIINLDGIVVSIIAQSFGMEEHENVITGLPISQLKGLIEILSNGEPQAVIGIMGQNVTDEVMNQTGMPKGVYVSSIQPDSPAFNTGIRNGDIIVKYEGEPIETMNQYAEKLANTVPGSIVDLTIMRMSTEGYREFDFRIVTETW